MNDLFPKKKKIIYQILDKSIFKNSSIFFNIKQIKA